MKSPTSGRTWTASSDSAARVVESGRLTDAQLDQVDGQVAALIDEAVAEAKAAPLPTPEDLLTDVYVKY